VNAQAVEATGLFKRFKGVAALGGIGFTVEEGRSLALVGPDGAGKTTTMRAVCGLLLPDEGQVRIFGDPPTSPSAKARIGYLSQRFSLYGDLSVDENIAFFAEIHGIGDYGRSRDRLLDFTRLRPFRNRQAGRLSGGMKQKLALACALVHQPRILIMDEPTTGVDPVSRREFWAIVAELGRDGMTVIAATPYLDEAERFDAVGLLDGGRFLALDSPGALKAGFTRQIVELVCPEARRAAAFVGAADFLGREESGFVSSVQAFGDRVALLARDGEAARIAAASALAAAGIAVSSSRLTGPSLENVFMELLGGARR
jgi:ABC-2 type transport system ATP-binding protein